MSRYKLTNEGCTTPAGEQAFTRYNEILQHQPDQLAQAIATLALNEDIPESHQKAASAVTDVLDTTNNGTQIGIGPDTETGWAHVFDDEDHRAAQTYHNQQAQAVRELAKQLEQARQELEELGEAQGTEVYEATASALSRLEVAYEQAQAELIARRRLRGMQTLKVIAHLNGARELEFSLPLAA